MTSNDGLLEFNLVNIYKMYENFNINVELGYIANFMDDNTCKKNYLDFYSYDELDILKMQIIFTYSFYIVFYICKIML